jgi:hypothetical protein
MVMEDKMSLTDIERSSLFYILSGNAELYKKHRHIYNYYEHCIYNCFDKDTVDFSSGMSSLIKLGFNLYNGWCDKYTTPLSLLGGLDKCNLSLATNALRIRFNNILLDELIEY